MKKVYNDIIKDIQHLRDKLETVEEGSREEYFYQGQLAVLERYARKIEIDERMRLWRTRTRQS